MTLIITMLLFSLGLNPTTGKINFPSKNIAPPVIDQPTDYRQQTINKGYYDNYNDANVNTVVNQQNQLIGKKTNSTSNTASNNSSNDANDIYNEISSGTQSAINNAKNEATKAKDAISNEATNIKNDISNIF